MCSVQEKKWKKKHTSQALHRVGQLRGTLYEAETLEGKDTSSRRESFIADMFILPLQRASVPVCRTPGRVSEGREGETTLQA